MAHSEVRDLETAQHEAAHVVVGVACGLRLVRAAIGYDPERDADGGAWFQGYGRVPRRREAWALMLAAGPAWDMTVRNPVWWSVYDRRGLRALVSGRHGAETMIKAATALLAGLTREHDRVTHALLERDITGADIAAICRGEHVDD